MDAVSTPGRGPGGPKVLLGELKVHNEDGRCRCKSLPVVTVTAAVPLVTVAPLPEVIVSVRRPTVTVAAVTGSLRAATAGDRDIMSLSRVKFTVRPGHWQ